MTIAVGLSASANTAGGTSLTTAAVTTTASGSGFVISVVQRAGTQAGLTFSDSKGNTYNHIGTDQLSDNTTIYSYLAQGGTGGSGHTATVTASASVAMSLFFQEFTGAASTGMLQGSIGAGAFGGATQSTGTLATTGTVALYSVMGTEASNNPLTFAESTAGMTITQSVDRGSSYGASGAIGAVIKSTSGTYQATWADGGSASRALNLFAFIGGTAGTAYTLTAASGSYGYTGEAATLTFTSGTSYTMLAGVGSYSFQASPSYSDYQVDAASGSYGYTGIPATLSVSGVGVYTLNAAAGSYGYTGIPATLLQSGGATVYSMAAATGYYGYSGVSAALTGPALPMVRNGASPRRLLLPNQTRDARRKQEEKRQFEGKLPIASEKTDYAKPAEVSKLERDLTRYKSKIDAYKALIYRLDQEDARKKADANEERVMRLRGQLSDIYRQQERAEYEIEKADMEYLRHVVSTLK